MKKTSRRSLSRTLYAVLKICSILQILGFLYLFLHDSKIWQEEKELQRTSRIIQHESPQLDYKNTATTRNIYNGRVIHELCQRVLSRSVAESNVLIISPDVDDVVTMAPLSYANTNQISDTVAMYASNEGHTTYMLPSSIELDQWWESFSRENHGNWFLFSYFLPGKKQGESIDDILSPARSEHILNKVTFTYIVIKIDSFFENEKIHMNGLEAVQTLVDLNYKVQLLSSSHFDANEIYRPNHLFQSKSDVRNYLSSGAQITSANEDFEALLFATQGLDLAIPSRLSFLTLEDLNLCQNSKISGRCDSKLDPAALGQEIGLDCPSHHDRVNIEFDKHSKLGVSMTLDDTEIDDSHVELWFGHEDVNKAEVACMRIKNDTDTKSQHPVACTTRILKKKDTAATTTSEMNRNIKNPIKGNDDDKMQKNKPKRKMNVISILLDPLSRNQFRRSLPNTLSILEELNYVQFSKYTAVGDNSGPNQAALFTGVPLQGGREGIKSSSSHNKASQWLWDEFRNDGYVTLKAEDICIKNSNMVQSMKPNTTHGEQLYHMFCFDFDRPNCLGKHSAAQYVLDYTRKFMQYSNDGDIPRQPWAAMLSFVDSHEDSLTVLSTLDGMLVDFIQDIDLENTIVVFSSDHGLHYGPSFFSNGEKERAEPLLFMHTPESMSNLTANKDFWVTPYDVHETITEMTIQPYQGRIGNSLLHPLPIDRMECLTTPGIPDRFCSILTSPKHPLKKCTYMPTYPPSIHNFYADITRERRPSWPKCKAEDKLKINTQRKVCTLNKKQSNYHSLAVKSCKVINGEKMPTYAMEVDLNITEKETVQKRKSDQSNEISNRIEVQPNILFIEIDSLSEQAASRHMPKTLSLLKSLQIRKDENSAYCPSAFCAAMFTKASVIGQNSIPNQLAALSGCTDQQIPGVDSYKRDKINQETSLEAWCPKSDQNNPFLFNITKDLGYLTFFGEEFCYNHSPYVVQENLFELEADYDMNDLFCLLSSATKFQQIEKGKTSKNIILYGIEHDNSTHPQPCVDGRSRQEFAFEYIRGIWNSHPDTPKFAYLNSLAAHDYSIDLAYQNLGIEAYDDYLSNFLQEMLHRSDSEDTIIVLRSDHGLQGGPSPIDFSTQVEHLHPFTNIIVPKKFRGDWIETLYSNQIKLVTGYDLYNTLRKIVTPSNKEDKHPESGYSSGIPDWSYDLLSERVPEDRNCADAKIPKSFCPCVEEREDLMPYYYVGHAEKLSEMRKAGFTRRDRKKRYKPKMVPGKFSIFHGNE